MRCAISTASAGAGRAVVHGGVGHLHGGQIGDLRLELEQVLQRALRDLGLVGRVAGQEFGALDEMVDAGRDMMLVGAGADEERHRRGRHVAVRHARQDALDFELALAARQVERRAEKRLGRHIGEEIVDGGGADAGQHLLAVAVGQGQVAHDKTINPVIPGRARREPGTHEQALRVSPSRGFRVRPDGAPRNDVHEIDFRNSWYCSSVMRPSSSAGSRSLSLTNQPLPAASSLTAPGALSRAPFTSTTSPDTGA